MKKFLTILILIAVMVFCLTSCREASTVVQSPNQPEASSLLKTYADRFDYFWRAINSHYVFWDVDSTDWDAVYSKYLPMFEELDKTVSAAPAEKQTEVIETAFNTAVQYYTDATRTLIDHHMAIRIFDPYRSDKYCDDYILPYEAEATTRDYYHKRNAKDEGKHIYWNDSTDLVSYFEEGGIGSGIVDGYKTATNLASKDELAVMYYEKYDPATGTGKAVTDDIVESFCIAYDITIDKKSDSGSDCHVIYLAMSGYKMINWMTVYESSPDVCPSDPEAAFNWKAGKTLTKYLETIRKYYDSKELAGVILDNRLNTGGSAADLHFAIGLYANEPVTVQYTKYKEGFGKTDYSSEIPFTIDPLTVYEECYCDLVTADIPYVVLCSLNSASMGEITTAGISSMKNGYVIGERTVGATGALVGQEPEKLIWTYGGTFGNNTVGPCWVYTSTWNARTFTRDGYKSIEGIGVTPDKEIYFKSTGKDNLIEDTRTMLKSQFKEAFSYISNH